MEASKYFHNDTPWNWNKTDPRRLIFLFYLRRYFLSLSLFLFFANFSIFSLFAPFSLSLFLLFDSLHKRNDPSFNEDSGTYCFTSRFGVLNFANGGTSISYDKWRERRAREARRFIDMLLLFDLGHLEFEFRPSTMIISRVGNGRGMNDWVKRA